MLRPSQVHTFPMQSTTLPIEQPAATTGINMSEIMNLMITMMIVVMMMKMMMGTMQSVG